MNIKYSTKFVAFFLGLFIHTDLTAQLLNSDIQFLDSLGQQVNITPEEYFKKSDSVINVSFPNDSSEDGAKSNYQQFKQFYETRCMPNSGNEPLLKPYFEALENARTASNSCGIDESFRGNWSNIGCKNIAQTYQNQGMVNAIWVDPSDPDIIIIGAEGGGIWKSIHGGADWVNLTDNTTGLGTMGVYSMAVNPLNTDEIYFTTWMFNRFYIENYGLGIWHSTDGGDTWNRETAGLTDPEFIYSSYITFCPYLVAGQSMAVMNIKDQIYVKLGNNSWTNISGTGITPNPNTFSANANEVIDIEFPYDMPGTFLLSTGWGVNDWVRAGIWKVDFNTITGSVNQPVEVLNYKFNNMSIQTEYNGLLVGGLISAQYNMEYLGNGNFFVCLTPIMDNNGNWLATSPSPGGYENMIVRWNINSPNASTLIQNDIYNTHQGAFRTSCLIESIPDENSNIIYVGSTQANIVYEDNNVWKRKTLCSYHGIGINSEIHADIRKIFIAHGELNTSGQPGINDIVYWGSDGGISRTSVHNIDNIAHPLDVNNLSADEFTLRIADNLNGDGLYLGDCYDIDEDQIGRSLASASYHNGYQFWNKQNNTWGGRITGDGMTSRYDKRFANSANYRLLEGVAYLAYHNNPNGFSPIPSSISLPEGNGYRNRPIQFLDNIMNIGIKNAWYSDANGYDFTSHNFITSQPFSSALYGKVTFTEACKQFQVSTHEPKIAYYLRTGAKDEFIFARGVYGPNPPSGVIGWGWSDKTPDIVSNINDGFPAADFCIDPKNENRVFLAIAGINKNIPGVNRVIVTNDGGDTWDDMSVGLSELPVNCLIYQDGSDDVLYAGCDDGAYYWNMPTQCWIKMNCNFANSIITRLRINTCSGKLLAATYGRGIWESDLYIPDNNPGQTTFIDNSNINWTTDKYIEGGIRVSRAYAYNYPNHHQSCYHSYAKVWKNNSRKRSQIDNRRCRHHKLMRPDVEWNFPGSRPKPPTNYKQLRKLYPRLLSLTEWGGDREFRKWHCQL